MEETNALLDAIVNFVEEKETPFKYDNGIVHQASEKAEKTCYELVKFLKENLKEGTYEKASELLNNFNMEQLSYCREEHVLYYKEGFSNCIKLIIASLT